MMNIFCECCSVYFSNDDELQNHLAEEKKKRTDESEMAKESEIYCVFCCKPFESIDAVEMHVAEVHNSDENENNDFLEENSSNEIKFENLVSLVKNNPDFLKNCELRANANNHSNNNNNHVLADKLTIYDVDMNVVPVNGTQLDRIKFCVRCNRHFDGEDNLRQHQLRDHAIRKRKRSSHPNGVEGIVVTGDGRWSCDVCGREFPTLKQAKVHKFKSHIEPIQKQEMLSHDFMVRNPPMKETGNESILPTSNYYCPILPNNNNHNENRAHISPISVEIGNEPSPPSEANSQRVTNESESETHSHEVDLSPSSSPVDVTGMDCETLWKIKSVDPEDTKISLSKIQLKTETKQDIINANGAYNFTTRQYMCSHCPASFSSRAVYSRHILVHRRGKAFACSSCGMAFTRNHTLKQHKDNKCVVTNPVVGVNCQSSDLCLKCGTYFANSSSHISHCKKVCKIAVLNSSNNAEESSSKDSVKSEETNAQYEGQLEIDLGETDTSPPMIINDFINNPAFVTKKINEFNCNLCCCYFASYKSIGHHLEHYHRIEIRSGAPTSLPTRPMPENESANVIQDFIHTCDECEIKYASKDALVKHKQLVHNPNKDIPKSTNEINRSLNVYNMDKPIKIEAQNSPPQKILTPSSFSLANFVPMYSSEALNLSTSQPTLSHFSAIPQNTVTYKMNSFKKSKVPPNANGEFECKECHKAFGCRSSLSNHVKSHFNLKNKPFSCEDCKQGFMSQISLQEHRKSQCPKLYGSQVSENGTTPTFSTPTMVYNISGSSPSSASGRATCCMHCNAAFPDRSLLEDHAAKEHSNESGEVMCIMCTRSFTTYMAFRVHMTKSHGGPNGTPLKSHLTSTTVSSSPIKRTPSQSPISSFAESPYANFHLDHTFSPLIRYTCPTCKKDFSTAQALGNHKRACGLPSFNETNVSKDQLII